MQAHTKNLDLRNKISFIWSRDEEQLSRRYFFSQFSPVEFQLAENGLWVRAPKQELDITAHKFIQVCVHWIHIAMYWYSRDQACFFTERMTCCKSRSCHMLCYHKEWWKYLRILFRWKETARVRVTRFPSYLPWLAPEDTDRKCCSKEMHFNRASSNYHNYSQIASTSLELFWEALRLL